MYHHMNPYFITFHIREYNLETANKNLKIRCFVIPSLSLSISHSEVRGQKLPRALRPPP